MKKAWKVELFEHDRWSGPNHYETKWFEEKSEALARAYVKQFNSKNIMETVPDYYTVAHNPLLVDIPEENDFL